MTITAAMASDWRTRAVDEVGHVRPDRGAVPWIARRLAVDVHDRWYDDVGAEVVLAGPGALSITTPHCNHGERRLASVDLADPRLRPERGETWADFRRRFLVAVDAEGWAIRRHLACFHRRGRARYDLVFEVGIAMQHIADGPTDLTPLNDLVALSAAERATVDAHGWTPHVRSPARILMFTAPSGRRALLRSDGAALTPGREIDLEALWRAGHGQEDLAVEVLHACDQTLARTSGSRPPTGEEERHG